MNSNPEIIISFKDMRSILLFSKTDVGKVRRNNEDSVASVVMDYQSFGLELNYAVLVVADGMGGHDMGEVASATASEKFIETITANIFESWHNSEKIKLRQILINAVEAANNEVWKISMHKPNRIGTTLVGAIISGNHISIANIGDSRAYLIHPGKSIRQITKDHTAVQEMVDAGMISREEAVNHPQKSILTRSLGTTPFVKADIFETNINDNILLLCSDGLYGMVNDSEICEKVESDIYESVGTLITLANNNGGSDNISVAMAMYRG